MPFTTSMAPSLLSLVPFNIPSTATVFVTVVSVYVSPCPHVIVSPSRCVITGERPLPFIVVKILHRKRRLPRVVMIVVPVVSLYLVRLRVVC